MPNVSVIMAVYNTEYQYLSEAINSILEQSYSDFEFIIVDDGSDALTKANLKLFNDKRIKKISNPQNIGLTRSLNIALAQASGKYIARMDADDIADQDRLLRQVRYLDEHIEVGVVGASAYVLGTNKILRMPNCVSREQRQVMLMFNNVGAIHPTAMIRKSVLDDNGLSYNPEIKKAQDYALWVQIIKYADIQNIDTPLLQYRVHQNQISVRTSAEQECFAKLIKRMQYDEYGLELTEEEICIASNLFNELNIDLKEVRKLFANIMKWNKKQTKLNRKFVKNELYRMWYIQLRKRLSEHKSMHGAFCLFSVGMLIQPMVIRYILECRKM